jgi:hypothetical protein
MQKSLKWVLFFLLCALLPATVCGQTTLVTATILDPNGLPYAGGTLKAVLLDTASGIPAGSPTVTISSQAQCTAARAGTAPCQIPIQGTFQFTLDGTGSIPGGGIVLSDNSLVTPAGTQWLFTVNESPGIPPPGGTGPQTFSVTLTISGASQNITSTLNASAPKLSNASSSSIPGITGPPTTGLMARYDIPPGDTVAALTDSSGNGANGIGVVGTPPTIAATGGLVCNFAGASILPSVLNTAKTIALYLTVSSPGSTPQFFAPLAGNGNGATGHAIQIQLNNSASVVGPGDPNVNSIQLIANNAGVTYPFQGFLGTGSLIFTMDTLDHFYLNGVETGYRQQGASVGLQTLGQYQVCGAALNSGYGVNSYGLNMTVLHAYFYSQVLTATQRSQLVSWFNILGASAGTPYSPYNPTAPAFNLFGEGDSIMSAAALFTPYLSNIVTFQPYTVVERGMSTLSAFSADANIAYTEGSYFNPGARDNLMFYALGTNDVFFSRTTAQAIAAISQGLSYWKTLGGRAIVSTPISRTGGLDANEQALTTSILQNWQAMGAIGMADFMNDANLGATGANTNSTYFVDGIHPTQAGQWDDMLPIAQRAVNRASGNVNWQLATTYTTGAAAATAITATSEATNTVTVSSTLNPPVGSCAIITGVTPAGYNSPTTGGCWFVLTTAAGNFTYWNGTAGLGVGTVFGVASVPLQKDQDAYFILGGAAAGPIFTLESCEGYSGQSLYAMVTNTNASPWVLTPFKSTETINGAATMNAPVATATNHPVVQLKAIPNAVGTGGCTWQASLQ